MKELCFEFQICGRTLATVRVSHAELATFDKERLPDAIARLLLLVNQLDDEHRMVILREVKKNHFTISQGDS